MKNTKTLLGIVAVFLLLFGIYKLSTFAIFDEEFKEIEAISIPKKTIQLKYIIFLPMLLVSHISK